MKKLILIAAFGLVSCSSQASVTPEAAAWQKRAEAVTIIRDDWGIPHVYGKTDADVVFGLMFAQP
jgi:acyl-homoserine lactone acylase PvdQ